MEADQKLGTGLTADVVLDDIVERSTQSYLVTEVLNMWEVSMGGSHILLFPHNFLLENLVCAEN
jgi:hypothetical protein